MSAVGSWRRRAVIGIAGGLTVATLAGWPGVADASTSTATVAQVAVPAAAVSAADDAAGWERIVPGGDCQCSDGSEYSFWSRAADPSKVVFMLEGGGACFSPETCDLETGAFAVTTGDEDDPNTADGIFDLDNPDNPFADYSFVFVPYCTGDVHLGNNVHEYAPELVINHVGMVNGMAAVDHLAATFPDAAEVVVIGESAGAVASPLYGGIISDVLPEARITVFADGSGGYPDVGGINALINMLWGAFDARPDWEVNADLTAEEWSLPGLWVQAGTHDPEIRMARFDYAYDAVQVQFAGFAGIAADQLLAFMDENETRIEAAGVDQASFTAPGDEHTLVRSDEFYTMEVGGVSLVDWVAAMIAGEPVDDVRCEVCEVA